jgi:hypothetical protein
MRKVGHLATVISPVWQQQLKEEQREKQNLVRKVGHLATVISPVWQQQLEEEQT